MFLDALVLPGNSSEVVSIGVSIARIEEVVKWLPGITGAQRALYYACDAYL